MTSVYDAMRIMGKDGVDVYDDIYDDEGACWDVWDDGPRAEGAVYRYVMEHVAFVRGVESQHGVHFLAEVSRFVEGNMDVLGPFSKVWNDPWYLVDGSDDGIESGISMVHCIMAGGYPEEAYEELAEAWGVARMDWLLCLDKWALEDGRQLMEAELCYDDQEAALADARAFLDALTPGHKGRAQVVDFDCRACAFDAQREVA